MKSHKCPTSITSLLVGLVFIFTTQNVNAKILTWDECVNLATQNNLDLQMAENNVNVAADQKAALRSGFLPHVAASASKNQSGVGGITSDSYSAQLTLSQNIFAGFSDLNRLHQADLALKNANLNLTIAKAKLSAELKQNFETLNYAQGLTSLTADIRKRREDNLRNVELRFNGGRENKGSVLLSRAYADQARYEDSQAKNQIIVAREQLGKTLGIVEVDDLQISGMSPTTPVPASEPNFSSLVETIPDFQLIKNQEAIAAASVEDAQVRFYPSLDFTGSLGRSDTKFFPENDRWTAGLTLSIPLFDGGRDYYSVKAARLQLNNAGKARANALQQYRINLRQAYFNFIQAVARARVDQSFRSAAEVRADIARSKYNNGLMTFDDWDVIESDLISKQKSNLVSLRERTVNESQWQQILGTGVIP